MRNIAGNADPDPLYVEPGGGCHRLDHASDHAGSPGGPIKIPPASGVDLSVIWESIGRPEIPLAPGVSISDLNLWLRPGRGINHPPDQC